MIFNINYFNSSYLYSPTSPPAPSTYSSIRLFGGAVVDTVWLENYIRTSQQVSNLDLYSEPDWDINTLLLAKFNSNLQAGNITSLPSPIDSWIIQRKATGDAKFTTIAIVDDLVDTYVDKLVKSKQEYTYQMLPKAGDVLGAPLEADPVTTDFKTIILLDPLTNEGYSFCLNMQVDSITVNEDVVESNTKGKYNTTLKGKRRFKSGTIGVIAVSDVLPNGALDQDLAFLDQLEDFITNGDEKILKFPKGMTYRVTTNNMSYNKLDGLDANGNTIWSINFDWREVGEL